MAPKQQRKRTNSKLSTTPRQCSTLLEDDMTRCAEIPTHGNPIADRCRVHHEQYRIMTKRYKDAQKFVDETLAGALIPSKEEIEGYTSISAILEKSRLMKKYVNAIREERTGRDIHHQRFFLKVDDGHKIRIKILAKQMAVGVEIRDALEARAMILHMTEHPAEDWMRNFQTEILDSEDEDNPDDLFSYAQRLDLNNDLRGKAAVDADDDVIELTLRFQREKHLNAFSIILEPDTFWSEFHSKNGRAPPPDTPETRSARDIYMRALEQYCRRLVFHDPHLFAKSLDKISFKDLIMDDSFGYEDSIRFAAMLKKRLIFGLHWWKDSLTEAIAIKDSSHASANMGSFENRVKILGGWIYKGSRDRPAPNKVWWLMLTSDQPEKDTENRYVRLCCNFDELHTFLSFSALVLSYNTPSFCTDHTEFDPPHRSSGTTRNHLSLCGVIVTDLVPGSQMLKFSGPVPSVIPAKKPGCITWVEVEMRAYMFGAIRDEPDEFTVAFLRELRARPDLFAVVTRSDSDPPRKLEYFGAVTDQIRTRKFEAPFQSVDNRPAGQGSWEVLRSSEHVLYGGGEGPLDTSPELTLARLGYLSGAYNDTKGVQGRKEVSFFKLKRFPVKYFLIFPASPTCNRHDLARRVAWAAFAAHGLVRGNYDKAKYDKASDVLFAKHARERLSFLPEGSFKVGNLASSN